MIFKTICILTIDDAGFLEVELQTALSKTLSDCSKNSLSIFSRLAMHDYISSVLLKRRVGTLP